MRHDPRDTGDRFDIVHQCGIAEKPLGFFVMRFETGVSPLPLHRLEQSRFFTADISSGSPMHGHIDPVIMPQNGCSEDISFICFVDGMLKNLLLCRILPANVDIRIMGSERIAGEDDPLDEKMGITGEDLPVLEGARLALIAVDNNVFGTTVPIPLQKPPLGSRGCPAAAFAAQTADLDSIDDALGRAIR